MPYGLAAYAFTENVERAIRVGEQLETGMVGINETRLGVAVAPSGGVKMSGIGRKGRREGLDGYLETRLLAICVKGIKQEGIDPAPPVRPSRPMGRPTATVTKPGPRC